MFLHKGGKKTSREKQEHAKDNPTKVLFSYHVPGLVWPGMVPALFKILKK
jgi:hypothetical protein